MKLWSGSKVVLVTSAVLSACSGDPTDSLRGGVVEVTASPTSLFIERGQTKQVLVEALDEQGNPLVTDFTVEGGAGLTVVQDPNYLPTSTTSQSPTSQKAFNVTANDLVASTFTLTAEGVSDTISVLTTTPAAEIPLATVTSSGPNASVPATLTVPAPYVFPAAPVITWVVGADTLIGILLDRGDDGRSVTVLAPPGAAGPANATVALEFTPDIPIATTTDVPFAIDTVVPPTPGTDDPATAPEVVLSNEGNGGLFDAGTFGAATCGDNSGVPCQLYKLTLPADATFNVSAVWNNTADLGVYFLNADGLTDTDQACDDLGNADDGGAEACTITLPAGTYLIGMVDFGPFYDPPDPPPTWLSLAISPAE